MHLRGTKKPVRLPPAIVARRFPTDVHLSDSSFILPPSPFLQGIAPQIRIHGVSIIVHRTGDIRFIAITSTKPPITGESPHVSVSDIESCSDELMNGDPDAAQIHATA